MNIDLNILKDISKQKIQWNPFFFFFFGSSHNYKHSNALDSFLTKFKQNKIKKVQLIKQFTIFNEFGEGTSNFVALCTVDEINYSIQFSYRHDSSQYFYVIGFRLK